MESQQHLCQAQLAYHPTVKVHAPAHPKKDKNWKKRKKPTDATREHLYRCHAQQSLSCPRCVAAFENQKDLDDHLRSLEPCKVANRKDGLQQTISPEQMDKLKKRKGLYGQSDVQKWFEIWHVLFPGHHPPESPCECWLLFLYMSISQNSRPVVPRTRSSLSCPFSLG